MTTRRTFIYSTAAAGVASLSTGYGSGPPTNAPNEPAPGHKRATKSVGTPGLIRAAIRRDESTLRLGGDGDNFHMSWAPDDTQVVAVCDGAGWIDNPKFLYNSRLFSISGQPDNAAFREFSNYPKLVIRPQASTPKYYNFGTLALGSCIYQFLSTFDEPAIDGGGGSRFIGAKLIYSADNGCTWRNQDGSLPVVWEGWRERSQKTMVFFKEPQDAFSLLTILQMGRGYRANRDGYVYVYSPNGSIDGTMNQLVMFRVPRNQILNRHAYEFFSGIEASGKPKWSHDILERAVVHTFPRGWVNELTSSSHPYAWHPSVAYNSPLGVYMMTNWGMGCGQAGEWFSKPSYLGIYVARDPWGPWTQIHEETAWMPNGDPAARAYQPQIAPGWISQDGRSFWMVWTDFQHSTEFSDDLQLAFDSKTDEEFMTFMLRSRVHRPYYAFNTQRVNLVLS